MWQWCTVTENVSAQRDQTWWAVCFRDMLREISKQLKCWLLLVLLLPSERAQEHHSGAYVGAQEGGMETCSALATVQPCLWVWGRATSNPRFPVLCFLRKVLSERQSVLKWILSKEFAQTFGSIRTPSLEEHQVLVVQKFESAWGQNGKMRKQTWAGKKQEIKNKPNDN